MEGKFLLLIKLVGLLQALAAIEPLGVLQERMHVVVVVLLVAQVTEIVLATVIAPVVFCAPPPHPHAHMRQSATVHSPMHLCCARRAGMCVRARPWHGLQDTYARGRVL